MMLIKNANFVKCFNKLTNCIVVNRNGKCHVREYSRNIKNGMPRYKATLISHYNDPPKFKNLFNIKK